MDEDLQDVDASFMIDDETGTNPLFEDDFESIEAINDTISSLDKDEYEWCKRCGGQSCWYCRDGG